MPVGQILQRLYLREQNEGNNLANQQQFYLTITAFGDHVRLRDRPAVLNMLAFSHSFELSLLVRYSQRDRTQLALSPTMNLV